MELESDIKIVRFASINDVSDDGVNPEVVTVFWLFAAKAPTAHKWLGLAEGIGNAEVLVAATNKLLRATTLFMIPTLSWKTYGSGMEPAK